MAFAPRPPRAAARIALLTFVTAVALTACSDADGTLTEVTATGTTTGTTAPATTVSSPSPSAPVTSSPPAAVKKTKNPPDQGKGTNPGGKAPTSTVTSDVSQLKSLGITLDEGVLIDVADDGLDRYLEIGENGVDFTGTSKKDTTMMALKPARVAKRTEDTKNRVVIAPPFWNEDVGTGSCVVDKSRGVLDLATCKAGALDQIWEVVPAGDSGQFELHGAHTDIRVEAGKITTDGQGYVGLQTIKFAG